MPPDALPNRKSHRLPAAVYALTGHEFFFTICARHKGAPFTHPALADKVIDALLWARQRYGWRLFCYCLMPDHLHFVCCLTRPDGQVVNAGARGLLPEGTLDHVARFKSFTTSESWKLGHRGPLWQKSSFDRVFDMQRPFEQVADYVLENPVRKGLVGRWEDWPYSRIVDPWW